MLRHMHTERSYHHACAHTYTHAQTHAHWTQLPSCVCTHVHACSDTCTLNTVAIMRVHTRTRMLRHMHTEHSYHHACAHTYTHAQTHAHWTQLPSCACTHVHACSDTCTLNTVTIMRVHTRTRMLRHMHTAHTYTHAQTHAHWTQLPFCWVCICMQLLQKLEGNFFRTSHSKPNIAICWPVCVVCLSTFIHMMNIFNILF